MQNNYQQKGAARKPVINRWEGIGIARSRSTNEGDQIKFFPFSKGGGALHFTLACSEVTSADENGNPRTRTAYIPVNVMTNKGITEQQLRAIVPGMKLRVVGTLATESYDSKKTGQRVSTLAVNAFVLEVLEMPMQMQQPYYGGYQQPAYPQSAPQQYGQYPGQMPPAGYAPQAPAAAHPAHQQAGVQYPAQQPAYPQPAPQQYGQYPGQMPPAGYAQPQAPAPVPPAPQQAAPVPPYYQPGPPPPAEEDMPADMVA